jgi:SP family arabinose:H+ symporter-like MFS transporter
LLGCIAGVILTSVLSDRLGRKGVMMLFGFMFLLSGLGCAFAPGFSLLVSARLIGGNWCGHGVGDFSDVHRGAGACNDSRQDDRVLQLAITVGILLAYFSNALLLRLSENNFQNTFLQWFLQRETWRPMFFVMSLPSAVFMALLIKIPESPRWLFSVNKKEKADAILKTTVGDAAAAKELVDMNSAALKHSNSQLSVFSKSMRLPLLIGIVLAILQQFCGINAIIYYGPRIFESAGIARAMHSSSR